MLLEETLITFGEATKTLPKVNGRRPSSVTLHRWAVRGVRGVKLEFRQLGGRRVTSRAALERFLRAIEAKNEASE